MGYKLASFDSLTLPLGNADWNNDTAGSVSRVMQMTNGLAFDGFGSFRSYRKLPYQLTLRADVMGYSTVALTRAALDALKAKRGVRGTLTRTDDAGSSHTCTARCLQVRSQGGVSKSVMAPNVEMLFEVLTPWKGTAHSETWAFGNQYTSNVTVTGTPAIGDTWTEGSSGTGSTGVVIVYSTGVIQYLLTGGVAPTLGDVLAGSGWTAEITSNPPSASTNLYALLPNNGNARCMDCIITVTEGGADAITAWRVLRAPTANDTDYFIYTGALTAAVTVDCDARTVLHGTTDAYANFALQSAHTNEAWLTLSPGINRPQIIGTGGTSSSTINFAYNDTWE